LAIAWSVLLQYTDADYLFGIFKLSTKQIMANKTLHSIISEIINSVYLKVKEKLVDIKGVNGRRTQYNGNKGTFPFGHCVVCSSSIYGC
jgi:hypothetical protein